MYKWGPITPRPNCACGCGQPVEHVGQTRRWNKFVSGHHQRTQGTGRNAHRWSGGLVVHKGYVHVFMPEHPRAIGNYVRRSLLVAEEKLGRPLERGEIVHHKNQQRDDDRPENVEVLPSQSKHIAHHNLSIKRAKKLTEEQVREIKALMSMPHPKAGWRQRDPFSNCGLARRFGVEDSTIASIRKGEYWKHV
jgi:hypothetical protein